MRNMSFALTTNQFKDHTKDVTRRLGWTFLAPGQLVQGVVKGMGLKKGEKVERLGIIRIVTMRQEPLNAITQEDVIREGFPQMTPSDFVAMFSQHNNVRPHEHITRIEFEYMPQEARP